MILKLCLKKRANLLFISKCITLSIQASKSDSPHHKAEQEEMEIEPQKPIKGKFRYLSQAIKSRMANDMIEDSQQQSTSKSQGKEQKKGLKGRKNELDPLQMFRDKLKNSLQIDNKNDNHPHYQRSNTPNIYQSDKLFYDEEQSDLKFQPMEEEVPEATPQLYAMQEEISSDEEDNAEEFVPPRNTYKYVLPTAPFAETQPSLSSLKNMRVRKAKEIVKPPKKGRPVPPEKKKRQKKQALEDNDDQQEKERKKLLQKALYRLEIPQICKEIRKIYRSIKNNPIDEEESQARVPELSTRNLFYHRDILRMRMALQKRRFIYID